MCIYHLKLQATWVIGSAISDHIFKKIKTIFMFFCRQPLSIILKKICKIPIRCKGIPVFLNQSPVSTYNTSHTCARHVIYASERSERHFKIQVSYFGYCRIPLNTEKITIVPIFFCKRRCLTRLWRNLPIWVEIASFNSFF